MTAVPVRSRRRPMIPEQGSRAMPFMVIYRTSDGVSRYDQVGAIDEAALFVERLRNKDGIDQIHIYRMEEIGFAFKPYYKVELGSTDRDRPSPAADDPGMMPVEEGVGEAMEVPVAPSEDEQPAELVEVASTIAPPPPPPPLREHEPTAANGRQGLFGR